MQSLDINNEKYERTSAALTKACKLLFMAICCWTPDSISAWSSDATNLMALLIIIRK